jgi:hypothetical protein
MTGLPREFTFVFLVARPLKAKSILKGKKHETKHEKDSHAIDALTHSAAHKCLDHATTYTPMHIGIHVRPRISNIMNGLPGAGEYEEILVADEAEQGLVVIHTQGANNIDTHTESGYYNFAKLPGNFEDLIELPVASVVRQSSSDG